MARISVIDKAVRSVKQPTDEETGRLSRHSPEVARIVRLEFERLIMRLERAHTNEAYMCAIRFVCRIIRESKPD